ncbi:MAG TPA: EVE domain-containing protein [Gammaproteobacteria bacterium]|nr:EVE domain-containing protein [Gammaproteobacteria bacterium]
MNHWLMKSEPSVFGIDDLARAPGKKTLWDGVRNYQARNFMRDMRVGDEVFFYHSNCAEPGIVGIMRIVREAYPDPTQFDRKDPHYDPKSKPESPRWSVVDVEYVKRFKATIALSEMKQDGALDGMKILQRGNRLSVTPVSEKHWKRICMLAKSKTF